MRIGILGGTFDPIHLGHLYLAKKICQNLNLKKIIFVPTYVTPHKKDVDISSAIDRHRMVSLAIAKNKRFEMSDIEIKRKGRSYSVETLKALRKKYGVSTEIFFITGSDSLKDIDKWKNLKTITRLCKFVVVKRPGFGLRNVPSNFLVLKIGAKDIRATMVRQRVRKGRSIEKMVPHSVRSYINKHRLYV